MRLICYMLMALVCERLYGFQEPCKYLVGPPDQVVASAGKIKITRAEYLDKLSLLGEESSAIRKSCALQKRFLNYLVKSSLAAESARRANLDKTKMFKKRRDAAMGQILANMYLDGENEHATLESEKAYFTANKRYFSRKLVDVQYIAFPKRDDVLHQVKRCGAKSFDICMDELWKMASKKANSIYRVGSMQVSAESKYPFEFEKKVMLLAEGSWSEQPIKAEDDFLLVKVMSTHNYSDVRFELMQKQVKSLMRRDRRFERENEIDKKIQI